MYSLPGPEPRIDRVALRQKPNSTSPHTPRTPLKAAKPLSAGNYKIASASKYAHYYPNLLVRLVHLTDGSSWTEMEPPLQPLRPTFPKPRIHLASNVLLRKNADLTWNHTLTSPNSNRTVFDAGVVTNG